MRSAIELLEDRLAPATYAEGGAQLNLDLTAAGSSLGIVSNGATYTLTLTGDTWTGVPSANVTHAGSALTVTSAGLAAFTSVAITDNASATGAAVTFADSGANTYTDSFAVTLDNATAGNITFNGATRFASSAGLSAAANATLIVSSGALITAANTAIGLTADNMTLSGTITTGTATTTIKPWTAGTLINLGGADNFAGSPRTLGLTDPELATITAGTLQVGDAASGAITVSATISHQNNLMLTTGAGATINAAITMAVNKSLSVSALGTADGTINLAAASSDLTASGTGAITLTAVRNIVAVTGSSAVTANGNLTLSANTANTGTGDFIGVDIVAATLTTTAALSITGRGGSGSAGLQHGIRLLNDTSSGIVQPILRASTAFTLDGTGGGTGAGTDNDGIRIDGGDLQPNNSAPANLVFTGRKGANANSEGFTVGTSNITIRVAGAAASSSINISSDTLNVATSNVNLSVSATNRTINLKPLTPGTPINFGAAAPSSTSFVITSGYIGKFTCDLFRIGDTSSGPITISGALSKTVMNVSLVSGGAVTALAGATLTFAAQNLSVNAGGAISLTPGNQFATIALTTTTGAISYVEASAGAGVTLGSYDGVNGVSTPNGSISISTTAGAVAVNNTAAAVDINAGTGSIAISVGGADNALTIAPGAALGGSGGITLTADKMTVDSTATITATGAAVTLKATTAAAVINVGSTVDTTAATLELSDTELDRITAASVLIGDAAGGAITVTANISPLSTPLYRFARSMAFSAAGGLSLDISSASAYERVQVTGNVTIDPASTLLVNSTYNAVSSDVFTLLEITNAGGTSGPFNGRPEGAAPDSERHLGIRAAAPRADAEQQRLGHDPRFVQGDRRDHRHRRPVGPSRPLAEHLGQRRSARRRRQRRQRLHRRRPRLGLRLE